MNRRDFLGGMLAGVGVAGAASIVRIKQEDQMPEFKDLDTSLRIASWAIYGGPSPEAEHVRKLFLYSLALPDNPVALMPAYIAVHGMIRQKSPTKMKADVINSREFYELMMKFGKYLV